MKHIFILNPAAGKGRAGKDFPHKIIETCKRLGADYELHKTTERGDGEHFVKERCKSRGLDENGAEETLRFYACGGDGTLNEVVNGAFGYKNVEITAIPTGTGNDFIRNFNCNKKFLDIERQIKGEPLSVDLIQYETKSEIRYGINMFNIGLDSDVVVKVAELKKKPLISGTTAYVLGVAIVLGKKEGVSLEAEFDDGTSQGGDIMLIAIANGCYCGGGFKGVPLANIQDGLIDVSIVEMITRRTFLSLIGKYKKGTHLEDPNIKKIVTYKKCRSLYIKSEKDMRVSIDGEISLLKEVDFKVIPKAINFSIPQGC